MDKTAERLAASMDKSLRLIAKQQEEYIKSVERLGKIAAQTAEFNRSLVYHIDRLTLALEEHTKAMLRRRY